MYFGGDYHPEHWVFPYAGTKDNPEARWEEDARLMAEAGVNVIRFGEFVWGNCEREEGKFEFDWMLRLMDVMKKHGIKAVLCTPTAAPPIWLTRKHPEVLPVDENGLPHHEGTRHAACLNSGVFWDYSKRIVTELAKATGGHEQLVAWQIDSGVGGHTTEFSFNEETRNDWHAWLQAKYETVENLNDCMGGRFWGQLVNDFSEVPMPQRAPTVHNPALVLRSSMVAFSLIPAKEIRGFIVKSSRSAKKSNCWIRSSRDPKSRLRPAFFTHMIMPGV